MENWELDFEWLRVQHIVKDSMRRDTLPDLNTVLLLIGIQELGRWKKNFSKEEKQDLMHIAVCRLLDKQRLFRIRGARRRRLAALAAGAGNVITACCRTGANAKNTCRTVF